MLELCRCGCLARAAWRVLLVHAVLHLAGCVLTVCCSHALLLKVVPAGQRVVLPMPAVGAEVGQRMR
jgi:hypothetical protein